MSLPKKLIDRHRRKKRIRAKVTGTATRPRMSVYRSLGRISVQLIDDASGTTVAAATTKELKAKSNTEGAKKLGELIAKKAKDAKITAVVFDRNSYKYHGRVQQLAEAARAGGLQF